MMIRIFIASLLFDFGVWMPLFFKYFQPWIVNLHQSGEISFATFSGTSLIASLIPLAFMAITMGGYAYFDSREPMELKTVKNNKKRLVSVKAN